MTNGNGLEPVELPAPRLAVVEQGLRIQQETAAERDQLLRQLSERDTTIAGLKAMLEVSEFHVTQLESRANTATLERDEAVARRAAVETVLGSMLALGRAFQIKSEPLITGTDDEQAPRDRDVSQPLGPNWERDPG